MSRELVLGSNKEHLVLCSDEKHLRRVNAAALPPHTAIGSQISKDGLRVTIKKLMETATNPEECAYRVIVLMNAIRGVKDASCKSVAIIHQEIIVPANLSDQVGGPDQYTALVEFATEIQLIITLFDAKWAR